MMYEVNQKTLAEALGISAREVRNLREQGMFPFIAGTKKYDLTGCVSEYVEFKIKSGSRNGTSLDKEREQAEHEKLKKEITKIKLRKLKGEVHSAADVEEFLTGMLIAFRARLLAVPAKVAPLVLGETDVSEIIGKLKREMLETLDELSEYDPEEINGGGMLWNEDEEDEDGEDEEDNED